MQKKRQLILKNSEFSGNSVVYIMSRDQRTDDNHTLLSAQQYAIDNNAPLYVLFILRSIRGRSREHYDFMIEGLRDVEKSLKMLNIPFTIRVGNAEKQIENFIEEVNAGAVFFDFSPLVRARSIVKNISNNFNGYIAVVDTHNIIPLWVTSDKQEFAAHTIRIKIHRNLADYLEEPKTLHSQPKPEVVPKSSSETEIERFMETIPKSGIKVRFKSGQTTARVHLANFIKNDINSYALSRNNIEIDNQSNLSPYLHFGQLSSLRVALEVVKYVKQTPLLIERAKLAEHGDVPNKADGMNTLFEEMIVRKELSDNFCFYNNHYRAFESAPEWAKKSLDEHTNDKREFIYSIEDWEKALTHDVIWNASQVELTRTGKIHGYMRMYWAKKILEWSSTPEEAIKIAVFLNDKYSIDGGDPNGYVGILWSIAGLHDRPWFERPVYGKIRYMNDSGLKRKFDTEAYIERANSL